MDETTTNQAEIHSLKRKPGRPRKAEVEAIAMNAGAAAADPAATAYAYRVWCGQSPDLPVSERISRVVHALTRQNLPTDGVTVGGHSL